MDTKTMQIGDYLWTPGGITGHISNEKLKHRFFSWTEFSTPTSYTKCDGSLALKRKTKKQHNLKISQQPIITNYGYKKSFSFKN